ncbi:MAG: DUF1016 family protein [Nanoarchaeota archaeon]|nr:DUF1016 family protein [Nanoarchaeota archaeon]
MKDMSDLKKKDDKEFLYVISLINKAKEKALLSVNQELIRLYWQIGRYISEMIKKAEWGEGVVDTLADFISGKIPGIKGFNRRNLFRMRQFYETYDNNKVVSPLVTQICWSNHLLILSKTKSIDEKEFYIRLSIRERYSKRELERQIDSGIFERSLLFAEVHPPVTQSASETSSIFRDTYILDFLNLPETYSEGDLQQGLVENFKNFVLEFGKDFAFVGREYRISVGNKDYFIDLLFYHRELRCLVAIELKIDDFKPEYLGKMNFYLEALDRDVRKPHENPSVGIILCKSKDNEVVEYAMSRNMSASLVAEYKTKLIDKRILRQKLEEFYQLGIKNEESTPENGDRR